MVACSRNYSLIPGAWAVGQCATCHGCDNFGLSLGAASVE